MTKRTPRACCGRCPAARTGYTPACACAAAGRPLQPWRRRSFHFDPIAEDDLLAYVRTPEPYDKAGAYAIQGHAALWCSGIEGCYYNIMAWPVRRTAQLLKEFLPL